MKQVIFHVILGQLCSKVVTPGVCLYSMMQIVLLLQLVLRMLAQGLEAVQTHCCGALPRLANFAETCYLSQQT